MRTFLGILMVFIVSGDEDINGVLDDSVLLPCSCPSRNLKKEFKWQMDKPETAKIFKQRKAAADWIRKWASQLPIGMFHDALQNYSNFGDTWIFPDVRDLYLREMFTPMSFLIEDKRNGDCQPLVQYIQEKPI
ncbi:uncharacterized protein si:dkey-192g7.3 isoform X2 [Scomber scombrus]|uniref:uncharacterized protein si:dkey-192g7.3 isoform X2 n=1 Tax=Scomber scombrus TaxID=13677 RepID=UPI002DD98A73|nr:uncharacterized protein si:dkey-192g7.3 isoform X2 [Scomber scombrus]